MLSIEECDTILKQNNAKISKDVLKELREYLYFLANLNNIANNEEL